MGNGTGPNPDRQEGPHAHQTVTDTGADHVLEVDLGADKVNVPGVAELIKSIRDAATAHRRIALIHFLSASPPQIGKAIRDKLANALREDS